jgi:hypothetical protein
MPASKKAVVFACAATLGGMLAVGAAVANAQGEPSGVPTPRVVSPELASYPGNPPSPAPAPATPSMLNQFRKFLIHNVLGEASAQRVTYRNPATGRYEPPRSKPWESTTRTR